MNIWILRLLRTLLGVVFIYASFDKIIHPAQFAEAVHNYRILPDGFINVFALILPWVEFISGLCLILAVFELPSLLIVSGLSLTFLIAVTANVIRGIDVACGCFSTDPHAEANMISSLLFDVGLLILCALALTFHFRRARKA